MEEDKKSDRKRRRFAARLHSSKGIISAKKPGPIIVVCNAGQATGFKKNDVANLIECNKLEIPVPKLIAEKGQSHSFLEFDTTETAVIFFNMCNSRAKDVTNGNPLYLNYVDKVPNNEMICSSENPKGLLLLNNFITIEEEQFLFKLFDWTPESANLKNREVKHYGFEFRYGSNDVDLNNPLVDEIPKECGILWQRLKEQGFELGVPDQLTVNKYSPGHGIPSHIDKHSPFGKTILSLSLGSDVVMDWRHHSGKYVPVLVPARSLLIMQDEARYDWQHGIQPRTYDPIIEERMLDTQNKVKVITNDTSQRAVRISLTFRWTRNGPCECQYKTLCDTANNVCSDNLEDDLASNLEELHVHQVYEQIAGHFSTTRHKPWPKVVHFMEGVTPGSVVLDLGCGNGKNILRRNDIMQLAGERSSGLLSECQHSIQGLGAADCVRLDLLNVPLRDQLADVVICIAVIHHFSSYARRLQAICSIHRLLRRGGRALITVWAKDQTKSNYLCKNKLNEVSDSSEIQVSVGGVNLPVHENRTQFKHKDLLVPWKLRKVNINNKLANNPNETLLRYYHVFEENELDQLCENANFAIEKSFYEEGNWCVICTRK